jgi:hypothetical protein
MLVRHGPKSLLICSPFLQFTFTEFIVKKRVPQKYMLLNGSSKYIDSLRNSVYSVVIWSQNSGHLTSKNSSTLGSVTWQFNELLSFCNVKDNFVTSVANGFYTQSEFYASWAEKQWICFPFSESVWLIACFFYLRCFIFEKTRRVFVKYE